MDQTPTLWAPAAAVVAAFITYLGLRYQTNKSTSTLEESQALESHTRVVDAWEKLLDPYREEVKALRDEVHVLRQEVSDSRSMLYDAYAYIRKLISVIQGLKGDVPARPDSLDFD